jgi:BarA-like signal transduction histidine kinase
MKLSRQQFIETIKSTTNLEVEFCETFNNNEQDYYSIMLKDKLWVSQEYNQLIRAQKQGFLKDVQPNGVRRVAVWV